VEQTRKLLERIGLPGRRLQMINISSAMAGQFAFAAAELTAEVRQMGPSPLRVVTLPAEVIEQAQTAEE
jgi:coenzyme F420-reducing hydrogenase delta subunit